MDKDKISQTTINAYNGFLDELEARNFSANGIRNYRLYLGMYLDNEFPVRNERGKAITRKDAATGKFKVIGWRDLPALIVPAEHITPFLLKMRNAGRAANTVALAQVVVKEFYRYVNENGISDAGRVASMRAVKRPKAKPRPNSDENVDRLIALNGDEWNNWEEVRNSLMIDILRNNGPRISELLALNIEDLDFECIHINGKGNKERDMFIVDENIRKLINRYLELRPKEHAWNNALFVSKSGNRVIPKTLRCWMKTRAKKRDIKEYIIPHRLRHTAATNLANADDGNIITVQHQLGHESIETSRMYVGVSKERIRQRCIASNEARCS